MLNRQPIREAHREVPLLSIPPAPLSAKQAMNHLNLVEVTAQRKIICSLNAEYVRVLLDFQ